MTVHRALRPRNDWLTRFAHDADNPWPYDIVLLDEVSMVDLPLMERTLAAVREGARVVLLGDADQLPSVGPGAVLGDLVGLSEGGTVAGCVSRLVQSRRFDAEGGVGTLAKAVHGGDVAAVMDLASKSTSGARVLVSNAGLSRSRIFVAAACEGWSDYCDQRDPEARLRALDRFRVLCATRVGVDGVERVNEAIERGLERRGKIRAGWEWYDGRPILIRTNDYALQLFNGDTGVIARDAQGVAAWFWDGSGGIRRIVPARLPSHETCFAMTVHKSQGSEFIGVLMGLPSKPNRVLSRELLYTGITRARERIMLMSSEDVLRETLGRRGERASGLAGRLS
jgi:exodeoxyribonuclease V alpha subunit